jgi:hypothetical protein
MVLDYKTGASSYFRSLRNDPVDRGRRLQLAVYALALKNIFGEGVRIRAAYWFVSAGGKFALMPPDPADLDDMIGPFESALTTIVGGIRQGLFPANPGKEIQGSFESCRRCDFDTLCPTRRDEFWRRKRGDRRLEAYVSLSEGGGPGD